MSAQPLAPRDLRGLRERSWAALELAFSPSESRGVHGRWVHAGTSALKLPGPPGSFEHARVVDAYADTLPSDDARTLVHKSVKSMIARDIPAALRHIEGAKWHDSNFSQGAHLADLEAIAKSYREVPKTAAYRNRPPSALGRSPVGYGSAYTQSHPGKYRPGYGVVGMATELAGPSAPAPRMVATADLKRTTASGLRRLAAEAIDKHPTMNVHQHLRDAAAALDRGQHASASRHLTSAMHVLSPGSLYRHGFTDDASHGMARETMDEINRHLMRVRDLQEAGEENERRAAEHRSATAQPSDSSQPGAQLSNQIDLVGQKGYVHGWRYVGVPGQSRNLYQRLRKRGHSHEKAMDVIRKLNANFGKLAAGSDVARGEGAFKLANGIELSARTAMLERTPAPYGKPGGPGLYHVKGLKHSDYLEQIVQALMRKRGMDKGKATAIARGAIRRWRRGGGHVHPEVRAAAAGAEAEEVAAQARAKGHANDPWEIIDLASVIELFNPYHAPTGQFTTAQGAQPAGKNPAQRKAQMLKQAASDRQRAAQMQTQLRGLVASYRATIAAQRAASRRSAAGSKTAKGGKQPAKAAKPAKPGAKSKSSTPRKRGVSSSQHAARMLTRITALRAQIAQLRAQARALTTQAHKL